MQPMYNNEDEVCGIIYNEIPYYFVKNLQGDVIAITDHNGQTVARYSYDAWGVPTVTCMSGCSIGNENPFRYRGYYYDTETSLYYLQSRYYDANTGRFVNGDRVEIIIQEETVLSVNMVIYCLNQPISRIDEFGTSSGYIDNQDNSSWKSVAVGFWGNVKDNGCGAIAIYNILYSYSKKITITKVLSNLRLVYGSFLYNNIGVIGISPASVTLYLASKFIFKYTGGPITTFWGIKAELSDGIIVLYQHKGLISPLHYVAGIKTGGGVGGSFRFYNDDYYKKKFGTKSISIWKYLDLLKENGCKPLLFWGVSGKLGWW